MASDVADDKTEDEGRYRGFDVTFEETTHDGKTDSFEHNMSREILTENDDLDMDMSKLKQIIKEQAETIEKMNEKLLKQSNELTGNVSKRRKLDSVGETMNLAMVAETYDKDEKIRELNDKIERLENQLRDQKNTTLQSTSLNKSTKQRILPQVPAVTNVEALFSDLKSSMEKRMSEMDSKMTLMKETIDEKLKQNDEAKMITANKTYSNVSATDLNEPRTYGNTLQSIIETKNAEIVVENERQRREANIIIHGIKENAENAEENKKSDDAFITKLFQILGVNAQPKLILRLGKLENIEKSRPIKLVMSTVDEKNLVMSRLPNLKAAEDQYRRISVRDDYTPDERVMIRTLNEKAQQLNKAENTNEWKLRGSPKNGLRLIRIKSRENETTEKQHATTVQL